jgi:hypothetical protein
VIPEPTVHLAQTVHLSYLEINTISKQTKRASLNQHHLEVPSGVPEKISMPVEHSAQTVHLFYVEINTISKRSKMSFLLTNVT